MKLNLKLEFAKHIFNLKLLNFEKLWPQLYIALQLISISIFDE